MNNKFLQFLGLTKRTGKLIEGYNKCEEVIKKEKIDLIIFSNDISIKTKEKFVYYCEKLSIPYIQCFTKTELGEAIGRAEVNILSVTDINMAKKLLSHYETMMSQKTIGGE
ncbi:ribosomal L7Ae/L30e/S12e/Gadd45 family protein [Inconstantimicrobium mannanitabidum]|uniref:50S ribosomal protein L7/L12 n=1 Tax=Inconstantimicrobium mannanitabidum TaxID=1604901 RepID=A0ACB5RBP9_9CLOT|nr:ribosomal L7Ae/L30e/S12e/Gadd45 family protein [Clostridium sp. TW13]GKX66309.1 50S ribosomal protein L7/L12 [Clostridium sp. TW13]